jgi:hypothetical protein
MWKTFLQNGIKWCKIVDKWDRVGNLQKALKRLVKFTKRDYEKFITNL